MGIRPIADSVRKLGMSLGLWCAWTNAGLSEHPSAISVRRRPEWFAGDYPPDWQPGPFCGGNLCLACDEAREWAVRETQRLVYEYQLDYLKHDCGPIVSACARQSHRHRGAEDVSYWATVGYYEVMDHLREAYPELVLENCSGGGHIKDFGVIQRTHYTVTTDTLSNLPDRQSIYDSTFALPPLLLQAYTYNNAYPVEGDDPGAFLWRSAMMSAWQIDPTNATAWGEEERAAVRREVETYKRWVRPIMQDATVHHVMPRPDGEHWDGLFLFSPSLRRGTLYVFRPASDEGEHTVRLAGLDADARYLVWSEDGSVAAHESTGAELMERGIAVRLPARYTCDLVFVQDAREGRPRGLVAPSVFALRSVEANGYPLGAPVHLRWEAATFARCYRLVVSERADLSDPVIAQTLVLPEAELDGLAPGRRYYWSVTAVAWGGTTSSRPAKASFRAPKPAPIPGVTFLSEIEWLEATAGAGNLVRRDVNYYGAMVSIGGRSYRRALWTHAFDDDTAAEIVFGLDGRGAAEFRSDVGLDSQAGGGTVEFVVLLDDDEAARSPMLRQGERHGFAVPLGAAKRLTLRVLNGGDGHTCDHAVWGYPRLLAAGTEDPLP